MRIGRGRDVTIFAKRLTRERGALYIRANNYGFTMSSVTNARFIIFGE
jgi:hypothetical protein